MSQVTSVDDIADDDKKFEEKAEQLVKLTQGFIRCVQVLTLFR
jgi:hypothetical protein